jgi:geranylgeranyl diphosphate synthase type II
MDARARVERALEGALAQAGAEGCPPRLAEAMSYAVFPGGARIRPRLTLSVAWACGNDDPAAADQVAAAIELLHCGSLVHDDLPCFDDADFRRGKPSVHKTFGESTALLVGDALIVLAFETLERATVWRGDRLAPLVRVVGRALGAPHGIIAGQAWECEETIDLTTYHRAKTGALFAGACMAGAIAAGSPGEPWRGLGEALGEAFQVADDIRDMAMTSDELGKPAGKDSALGRPNATHQLGLAGALARLDTLVRRAVSVIPACPGQIPLRSLILKEANSFLPAELALSAA